MARVDVWRLAMAAMCVLALAAEPSVEVAAKSSADVPAPQDGSLTGDVGSAEPAAPALRNWWFLRATSDKTEAKRSGQGECYVGDLRYKHGEEFSLPVTRCIKYRCHNARYRLSQLACEWKSQCVPDGSEIREGCQRLLCTAEKKLLQWELLEYEYHLRILSAAYECEWKSQCYANGSEFRDGCERLRCIVETEGNVAHVRISSIAHDCEWNSQCVPHGTVIRDGCKKLRCQVEKEGNMLYHLHLWTHEYQCGDDAITIRSSRLKTVVATTVHAIQGTVGAVVKVVSLLQPVGQG